MRIGRDLKLIGKVESVVFHAEPISYQTFSDNIALFSMLKKELAEKANLIDWADSCYLFFKQIFGSDNQAKNLIAVFGRGVFIIEGGNRTQLEMAVEKNLIDHESLDAIYGKLLFFALNVYLPLKGLITTEERLKGALAASADCQTTLLNCTDFITKEFTKYFSTLTADDSTGENQTAS